MDSQIRIYLNESIVKQNANLYLKKKEIFFFCGKYMNSEVASQIHIVFSNIYSY